MRRAGAGGRGGRSGRSSFVLRGPTVEPAKGRPRGTGARRGRGRVGAATHRPGSRARGSRPRPALGLCSPESAGSGAVVAGVRPPTGRSHVWRCPSGVVPSDGKTPLSGAQLCLGFGAPRPCAARPGPRSPLLARTQPDLCRAGAPSRAASGARCAARGARAAAVGGFPPPGRVKFENTLWAERLRRPTRQRLRFGGAARGPPGCLVRNCVGIPGSRAV